MDAVNKFESREIKAAMASVIIPTPSATIYTPESNFNCFAAYCSDDTNQLNSSLNFHPITLVSIIFLYFLTNTRQVYDALDASYLTHYKPVNNLWNDEQRVDPKS